jgi:hypothetical protein
VLLQVRGRRRRDWPEDETGREVRKNGTDSLEGLLEQHYISQVGVGKYDHISVESTVFTLRGEGGVATTPSLTPIDIMQCIL